jgi:transposase
MSNHSIAKQLGLPRPTVIAARATFGTRGVQALTAKPTRNRPRRTLTPEVEKKILDTTLKTRPPDATQWTVRTLAKHLRMSRMMVHRVWQRFKPWIEPLRSCHCARDCRNARPTITNATERPPYLLPSIS